MGTLWLGVVPLVSGLVVHLFGLRYMATLSGIAFFSHQLGSFVDRGRRPVDDRDLAARAERLVGQAGDGPHLEARADDEEEGRLARELERPVDRLGRQQFVEEHDARLEHRAARVAAGRESAWMLLCGWQTCGLVPQHRRARGSPCSIGLCWESI